MNEATAFCRWTLPRLAHPEAAKEEIKAAGECRARERSSNPPKLRLSCACTFSIALHFLVKSDLYYDSFY